MILGDAISTAAQPADVSGSVTIDKVLRCQAQRRPDALALADAKNRESFTGGKPRRLTYAEADRAATAIAARLRSMGLPADAIIGIQLPNIVENFLALLGVLRAGMIAAPLPLLWRRADAVAALTRIGAKALIGCGRVGNFDHGRFAMRVAADVFSIRYVCGFGKNLPDGVVSFEDLFAPDAPELLPLERQEHGNAAAHLAVVTFEVGEGGIVPVARNHAELFAGSLAVVLEAGLAEDSRILSALAPASFAGIAVTLLPWLVSGAALVLHHPFDPEVFARQRRHDRCGTLVLPASVAFRLAETDAFAADTPACVIATWRSPEMLATSPVWDEPGTTLVDVSIFGETALVAARRGRDGRPDPLGLGPILTPRGGANAVAVAEVSRTEAGTVAMRGAMVPHRSFPPGIERSDVPHFRIEQGVVDTGYSCRVDPVSQALILTGPPAGVVGVGGYRFSLRDLQDLAGRADGGATLAAASDPMLGKRLIGDGADDRTVQAAFDTAGVNPLVAGAFRNRDEPGISGSDRPQPAALTAR